MKRPRDGVSEVIPREGPENHQLIFLCDKNNNNNINAEVFIAFPQATSEKERDTLLSGGAKLVFLLC